MKFMTAVAAILCTGSAVFAADPPDVKTFKFDNDVVVYSIRDKATTMKASLFSDVTKVSKFEQTKEEYPASVNCFVLYFNFKYFLIDAGNYDEKCSLVNKLESVKIKPKNVEYVLLTHLHPDHIGGLIDKNGKPVFPNAKVYVSFDEWKHWSPIIAKTVVDKDKPVDPKKQNEILRRFHDAYNGKIQTLSYGEPVVANLYAVKAVGHTPGHCFYRQGKLRFIGDLVHAVDLQVEHPEFCASFDNDKKLAYQTRRSLLESLCKDGNIVFGAHIPFPGVGTIEKDGAGFRFFPRD